MSIVAAAGLWELGVADRERTQEEPRAEARDLAGKSVLLIVGGGVAAYKSLELLRRLRERGVSTRVVLTASGRSS